VIESISVARPLGLWDCIRVAAIPPFSDFNFRAGGILISLSHRKRRDRKLFSRGNPRINALFV
jgi:hypothetical protein